MTTPLAAEVRIAAELLERLKAETGLDGDDLEDTIAGETKLPEMLAKMSRTALWYEKLAAAAKATARDNQSRAAMFERKAEARRSAIAWALQEIGWKKIPTDAAPDLSVTVRDGTPKPHIPDDSRVPTSLMRYKPEPDMTKIRDWLEQHGPQDWGYFNNPKPVLTIKSS